MKSSVLLLWLASALAAQELVTRTQAMMGTTVSLSLPPAQLPLSTATFARMKTVERALSSYDPEARIYRLNARKSLAIGPDTHDALLACLRYYRETGGAFNIAIGSVTRKAYRFGEAAQIPTDARLRESNISIAGVDFNRTHARLNAATTLDLGGMGKGFAVDKASEVLRRAGVKAAIIAASGDIRCLHRCEVAVQNPFGEGLLARFRLKHPDMGISTSGNYRRYVKDKANHHLIDPRTKRPARRFASVTLFGPLPSADLDAYATAVSVMEAPLHFLQTKALGYLLVTNTGEVMISDTFGVYGEGLKLSFGVQGLGTLKLW